MQFRVMVDFVTAEEAHVAGTFSSREAAYALVEEEERGLTASGLLAFCNVWVEKVAETPAEARRLARELELPR